MNEGNSAIDNIEIRGHVINLLNEYELEATENDIDILEEQAKEENAIGFNNYLDVLAKREVKIAYLMKPGFNAPIGEIVTNPKLDTGDFDFYQIKENDWQMLSVDLKVNTIKNDGVYPLYIGSSLWACNCHQDFIHSQFKTKCKKCGLAAIQSSQKIHTIQELFSWDS